VGRIFSLRQFAGPVRSAPKILLVAGVGFARRDKRYPFERIGNDCIGLIWDSVERHHERKFRRLVWRIAEEVGPPLEVRFGVGAASTAS